MKRVVGLEFGFEFVKLVESTTTERIVKVARVVDDTVYYIYRHTHHHMGCYYGVEATFPTDFDSESFKRRIDEIRKLEGDEVVSGVRKLINNVREHVYDEERITSELLKDCLKDGNDYEVNYPLVSGDITVIYRDDGEEKEIIIGRFEEGSIYNDARVNYYKYYIPKKIYVKICGLDGGINAIDATENNSLEDFARADTEVGEGTEFFEIEPYDVDIDVLESTLKLYGIIPKNATIKDVKVLRAISYDAENANEYQELGIVYQLPLSDGRGLSLGGTSGWLTAPQ